MMMWLLHIGIRIHAAVRVGRSVAVRLATVLWLIRLVELLMRIHIQPGTASDDRVDSLLWRRCLQAVEVTVDGRGVRCM